MQLEWSRHSDQVVSAISGLLDADQTLKDVTLSAQGRQLKAHRLMLAAASEYFKTLLTTETDDRAPIIYLRDVAFSELECLLQFIYSGKTSVPGADLTSFLGLARGLGVRGFTGEQLSPGKRKIEPAEAEPEAAEAGLLKHTVSEPIYSNISEAEADGGDPGSQAGQHVKRRKKHAGRSLDEMSSPAKSRNEVARSAAEAAAAYFSPPPKTGPSTPKTPLSPLLLPAFWTNTSFSQSFAASPPGAAAAVDEQDKENSSLRDSDLFKKPLPPPYALAMQKKASSVSLTAAAMTKEGGSGDRNLSFDGGGGSSEGAAATLDPNELAAKGATLLHHLAMWMIEEKKMKEEAEIEQEEEAEEAERRRAATLRPVPSTSMVPPPHQTARRSASLLSGSERPDSGFDSKDEGALAATPTKEPPPYSATTNLNLAPNPVKTNLNLPPNQVLEEATTVQPHPSGGEESSSPEVSGEMSRRAAIRQPVLRKRRMNFN